MVVYVAANQLEPNRFYKIETPITFQERDEDENPVGPFLREVTVQYGKFLRLQGGVPVFALHHGGELMLGVPISTDPIDMEDNDDIAARISRSGRDIVVSKLLSARVPEDVGPKIRRHMGGKKSRKTRRKGKKTLRRK